MKSYFKYAFGEIVLVVIGILIALYIKGLYTERMQNEQIDKIGKQIIEDLRSDTAYVNAVVRYYEPRKSTYLQIIQDSLSVEEHKKCSECDGLLTSFKPFTPNSSGYNVLKNFEVDLKTSRDSLVHFTRMFYTQVLPMLKLLDEMVKDDITDNLHDWRDNKPWYANMIAEIEDDRYYEYVVNDPIYKNRVANIYLLLYENVLPNFKRYSQQAGELADQWEEVIDEKEN